MAKKISKIDIVQGDVLADLRSSLEKTKAQGDLLKASLIAIDEAMKKLKADAKSLKVDIQKVDPSDTKQLNDLNNKQREANKLLLEQEKIRQAQLKTELQIERNKQAQIRTEKLLNNETQRTTSAYKEQSKLLNKLRNDYKDLAVQEKTNTKEAKDLLAQITKLDAKLKGVDASVGQYQRNVGNYGSAWEGLKGKWKSLVSVAGQLGLAVGGAQILRSSIDTIKEFGQSIADLSAITGASGPDLEKYKSAAIELGKSTQGGAKAVVEAFKLIGSAKPELLENADALIQVTEAARTLSKASGMELPEAATALTDAMNQFGASSDEAAKFINVLAAGSKFGAAEIPQVTEALLKFGAVSKSANVSIEESTALIEALAERGLKGAEAGTALRNVMLKLSAPDALPKEAKERLDALGISFADLQDKSKPFSERLNALKPLLNDNAALVKVFGMENAVAARNLIDSTARIQELNKQVTGTDTAFKQAEIRSKTLAESFNTLKETWNAYVLGGSEGLDMNNRLISSLDFLSKNLDTIVNALIRVIRLYIEFKAVQQALKLKENYDAWKAQKQAIKETGEALEKGSDKAKAFGTALKSIGFAIAIDLAIELATSLIKVANGHAFAENAMISYENKRKEIALKVKADNAETSKQLLAEKERVDNQITILERERQQRLQNGESAKKVNKEIDASVKALNDNLKKQVFARDPLGLTAFERNKNTISFYKSQINLLRNEINQLQEIEKKEGTNRKAGIAAAREKIIVLQENIKGVIADNKFRFELLQNLNEENNLTEANTYALEENTEEEKKNKKAKEEKVKTMKDANDEIERMVDLMKQTQELTDEIALYEAEADVQSAIQSQLDSINESGQYSIDLINQRIDAEYELKKAIIERNFLEEVDSATTEDEVINAGKRRSFELGKLEKERVDLKKDVYKQLETAQEEHADKTFQLDQQETEAQKDELKKRAENQQKYIDFTTKYLEKNIDARIALLEKEIEASQKQQQILQELAANGNIQASQSLAEQEKIEVEALRRKEKLERKKAQLQSITAFLNAYTNARAEGKTLGESLTIALGDKAVLDAIIETLPTFLEGTEDTGRGGNLDADGGFLSVLHPNERVMTKEQNAALMGMSNDEVVKIVQGAKMNEIQPKGWENLGVLTELNGLKDELQNIKKAILSKPETNIELGEIVGATMSIVKSVKKGNSVTYNKYKIK
jgi:TP901 family phage tail tape measure protein